MKEKQLNARPGMPVLLLSIVSYLAAIGLVLLGAVLLDQEKGIGALPLVLGILWLIVGFIPFMG